MRLASRFVLCWTVIALLALSGACAVTMSSDRRQRISDCLARCDEGRERPGQSRNSLTDCEKRCQGMK